MRGLFRRHWMAYRRWYLRDGDAARPSLSEARDALAHHMPELLPTWSELVNAVEADELGARMLTMYDPPPLLSGCSQAVVSDALMRNYDYDIDLFDGVILSTSYGKRRVIGMADQLWGLLDGMNDAGLATSFTFGGRREQGRGFCISLVLRYILETSTTVDEAIGVLRRIPVQGAYNVTLLDGAANHATVWLLPGEAAQVTRRRAATNHQGAVRWPEHATWTRTVERLDCLEQLLSTDTDAGPVAEAMLRPPLLGTRYDEGFGTLYTAVYRPRAGQVDYRWPGMVKRVSFDDFREEQFVASLGDPTEMPPTV
jgi:predicted choloylglycine hydrolase